jgi:hypothetical protein
VRLVVSQAFIEAPMRRIILITVCLSCLLAGCALSRVNQFPLNATVANYHLIKPGMSQKEVVALLGAPDEVDKKENLHWWTDAPGHGGVELSVTFNGDRQVTATQVESGSQWAEDRDIPGAVTPPYSPGGPRP